MLPLAQCLKTVVSNAFLSILIVLGGSINSSPAPLSGPLYQWDALTSQSEFQVNCFSVIYLGFTSLVLSHLVSSLLSLFVTPLLFFFNWSYAANTPFFVAVSGWDPIINRKTSHKHFSTCSATWELLTSPWPLASILRF